MPEFGHEAVLDRIIDGAVRITGARVVALGILDEDGNDFAEFRTGGAVAAGRLALGDLPGGRGVFGVPLDVPRSWDLADELRPVDRGVRPAGHPPMRGFLSVPIQIRGRTRGALYLAEAVHGDFDEDDYAAAIIVAGWAATAIELGRLHQTSERRRETLERAVRSLESVRDIATAIGSEAGLDRVLDLIARRGRALVRSGSLLVMLREGDELVVVASAGGAIDGPRARLPISTSLSGQVFKGGRAVRIADLPASLRVAAETLGVPNAHTGLVVPMRYRGAPLGVLAAFDTLEDAFTLEDEQALGTFATAAANTVSMAQSVEADRLRSSIAAAEAERGHWARELHDETLQGLGALQILLSVAPDRGDAWAQAQAIGNATRQIGQEIENLRGIIADLRPASIDALGLRAAIDALLDRRGTGDFEIVSDLRLPDSGTGDVRLAMNVETTVYRMVQEALTNVTKHAQARTVHVAVLAAEGGVRVEVRDDGVGFVPAAPTAGFGLAGMRERVRLAGGSFGIDSDRHGTRLEARLPGAPAAESLVPSM